MGGLPRQKLLTRTRVKLNLVIQHEGEGLLHYDWPTVITAGLVHLKEKRCKFIEGGSRYSEGVAKPPTILVEVEDEQQS